MSDPIEVHPGETQQFEFRGNGREWFGIWIVNLLLSIVTFGIYAAWAKVRRKKYFYNNTYVAGRNFDYHATGKQILIGRLIFISGYVIFSIAASLSPILGIVLGLALLVVLPFLIVKSMQFNARMSSFSNVRFNFVGKMGRAFLVFILLPALLYAALIGLIMLGAMAFENGSGPAIPVIMAVLGLGVIFAALPIIDRAVKLFVINHARLGKAAFSLEIALTPFLKAMGAAVAWVVLVGVVGGGLFGGTILAIVSAFSDPADQPPAELLAFVGVLYVAFFVAFLPASFIYQAITRNVVYSAATLEGGHQFRSTVRPLTLFWIALSNAVVTICTLFLMLPWAQVRLHRYLASQTFLIPGASLDDFLNDQMEQGMSVADAYTDLEGVDFGLPL
jgi:uncharacterized membrane protein YjgN (DUF898 family)